MTKIVISTFVLPAEVLNLVKSVIKAYLIIHSGAMTAHGY